MGQRQRLTLPFGGGLDRTSGVVKVDPESFGDLRNVLLSNGRMELRTGLPRALTLPGGTDLIAVQWLRQTNYAALLVYDAATRNVDLYISDNVLGTVTLIGTVWPGIDAAATLPPRVCVADMYSYFVIAHDELIYAKRQATKLFKVDTGVLSTLSLDLDRTGAPHDVKFRGVRDHLSYLVGWGYGSNTTPDVSDMLRISMPGDPTNFVPEHYFRVGLQGDPITGVGQAGSGDGIVLMIGKSRRLHKLIGYDRNTFDVLPAESSFGLLGARLQVTVNERLFHWAVEGPRVTGGGATQDLGLLLGYKSQPDVDLLAGQTDPEDGFAFFDPSEEAVIFCFGRWAYVLHLHDGEGRWRWSYRPYGVPLRCAGLIHLAPAPGAGSGGASSFSHATVTLDVMNYRDPSYDPTQSAPFSPFFVDVYPSFDISWHWTGSGIGDESVQVWTRSHFGNDVWNLYATYSHTAFQANVFARTFLSDYDIALRPIRGGLPAADYLGTPDTWPGISRLTRQTGGSIVSLVSGPYRRTSSTNVGFSFAYRGVGMQDPLTPSTTFPELTFVYEVSYDDGATWAPLATVSAVPLSASDQSDAHVGAITRYRLTVRGPNANTGTYTQPGGKYLQLDAPSGLGITKNAAQLNSYHLTVADPGASGADVVNIALAVFTNANVFTRFGPGHPIALPAALPLAIDLTNDIQPVGFESQVACAASCKRTWFGVTDVSGQPNSFPTTRAFP